MGKGDKQSAMEGTMTEIKKCPFCGGDEITFRKYEQNKYGHMGCADCCAQGPYATTDADAVESWNERLSDD